MNEVWMGFAATFVALGLYLLLRWFRNKQPANVDPDGAVLYQLIQAGSDLNKLHVPEFFLYFPSEQAAQAAAGRLRVEGFSAEVKQGAKGRPSWLCQATKSLILSPEVMREIRQRMNALTSELGGEYDGWGCPVVK